MSEVFVTLKEAAELEEIPYNTLVQETIRNENKYHIKFSKSDTGGRERKMVAVSSLSKKAREAYRQREKINAMAGAREAVPKEATREGEIPWYVNTDLEWYIENYKENYYKAVETAKTLQEFLNYEDHNRSGYAEEFSQQHFGKSARTLYRYEQSYIEAVAWANKKSQEDGCNYDFYKILCLCRKPKEAGQFPSFAPEVKQAIKNIWFNKDFAANKNTVVNLYDMLLELAEINKWAKVPSYQSVDRYINYILKNGMKNAHTLAAKGVIAWKKECMEKTLRDTKSLRVLELVQGDAHTFDCFVEYTNPNGTKTAIRPKLVAWIDMRSKMILGDVICKDPNSDIIKRSVLKMIYGPIGGTPEYIWIDNGKDFTGKSNTGRDRKVRSGAGEDELLFDDVTKGFYRSIGIKDYHRALPYQPWTKAQIERSFGTVCKKFSKRFTSYVGTLTGSKTDEKISKDIQKMLERGELYTLEEFYEEWTKWLKKVYFNRVHDGLKKAGEIYKTPYGVWVNEERYEKPAPPKSHATVLMMESAEVAVYQTGIHRFGYHYTDDDGKLIAYQGQKVKVKYDPYDLSTIYVFDKNSKKICEAVSYELMGIGQRVSKEALEKHMRKQKRQLREDRKILDEANVPFEVLNEQYVGFSSVAGGIDLMKSKKKKNKVVSLPEDRTFRQNGKLGRPSKEEAEQSEYISKTAQDALEKIRAIGG